MKHHIPKLVYILWLIMAFLAITGLSGGIVMLLDPSGASLRLPRIFLMGSPFPDYLVPGIVLFVFLGVLPALSLLGLLNIGWRWPEKLNIYNNKKWGWTFALYVSIVLILWMDFQVWIIGYWHFLQTFYALLGAATLIIALLPPVIRYYREDERY